MEKHNLSPKFFFMNILTVFDYDYVYEQCTMHMMVVLYIFGLLTGWSVMAVKVLMLLFLAGSGPSNIFLIQPPT